MKRVVSTRIAPDRHWVGDGFPVHGMFDYNAGAVERSPFLLLDYAAPTTFSPTTQRRGVGVHPHRGFETVTIVYAGEVEHRDSTGQGGVIGPGDVQWMTAGGGILHEEYHSQAYSRAGGAFEMVQLWVNLPAKDKMAPAGYQAITDAQIPTVRLAGGQGHVRVIAGTYSAEGGSQTTAAAGRAEAAQPTTGPARTHSPMNVWDLRLEAGQRADLPQPDGWSTMVVVQSGRIVVNGDTDLGPTQMATLSTQGTGVSLQVAPGEGAKVLLLAGQPLNEPVVGYGPFVMNTREQIVQAANDFNAGKFGRMG